MTFRFLIDANLPKTLALWISENHGAAARHVDDIGLVAIADEAIWRLALARDWVIVTKDADFVKRRIDKRPAPPIIWMRTPNAGKREMIDHIAQYWPAIASALSAGAMVIEVHSTHVVATA